MREWAELTLILRMAMNYEYWRYDMKKNKKGFTLIELIVVIAVLGILVLLAAPRFLGYTDKAKIAELTNNNKVIETASQMYHMDNDDWPRLTDEPYTADEVDSFAEKIYHLTGEEVELDPDGKYYDIDFDKLSEHVKVPGDPANYILQNPVGKVYALYKPTEAAKDRLPDEPASGVETSKGIYTEDEVAELVAKGYTKVSTPEELNAVRSSLSGKYIQTKDIDLTGYSDGEGWNPIGNTSASFKGTYDGGGFKITGLTIDSPSKGNIGLFGKVEMSTLENISIEDASVFGKTSVGILVGVMDSSSVSNSYSTGLVEGKDVNVGNVGGLIGYVINQYSIKSKISNSYSTANVKGVSQIGGLVGYTISQTTISDSYATGSVSGSKNYVGGLAGVMQHTSKVLNSYSTGLVTSSGSHVGGLVGYNDSTASNSYYDKQTSGKTTSAVGTGKTTPEMHTKSTYANWDFNTIWQIEEGVSYPTLRQQKQVIQVD